MKPQIYYKNLTVALLFVNLRRSINCLTYAQASECSSRILYVESGGIRWEVVVDYFKALSGFSSEGKLR
jgi:hypothetical protein